MDVHEYQAKELLASFGVTIPCGAVAFSPDQAVYAATELGGWHWAVKAQIHAGARGKAGGIKICRTYHEVHEAARALLGKRLVTAQTSREGKPVQRIYVEAADPYEREFYLAYVFDRKVERCARLRHVTGEWKSRRSPRPIRKREQVRRSHPPGPQRP
jgi:malate-CoA ligase subunit beta